MEMYGIADGSEVLFFVFVFWNLGNQHKRIVQGKLGCYEASNVISSTKPEVQMPRQNEKGPKEKKKWQKDKKQSPPTCVDVVS